MLGLSRSHVLPIGVDVGHDAVKLIQLRVEGKGLAVAAAARGEIPAEAKSKPELRLAAAAGMVRSLLDEAPFAGRRAVVALPREMVHIKNFRLPQMPIAELEGAVPLEARNLFPFDAEHAQVRFLPAGDVRQGSEVMQELIVLAARDEEVDAFTEQVHRAGLVLEAIDFAPCAIYRCVERFMRRREDETEVNVLVDVGLRGTQVVIGKGRDISFVKCIDIGGWHLHEAVGRKLGIPLDEARGLRRRLAETAPAGSDAKAPAGGRDPVRQAVLDGTRGVIEQLAREVSLCLRYHSVTFRGQRPSRVRVYGGEAADPQLRAVFNTILTIPVDPGRPLFSVETTRAPDLDPAASGDWAMALGLAMKTTTQRFGARDGRTRDALAAARLDATHPPDNAEGAESHTVGAGAEPARQEVSHA